jgi:type IV pilus assembly protein PilQ
MSMRAHGLQVAAALGIGLLTAAVGRGQSLKNVEVQGTGEAARIVLDVDGVVSHRSFKLSNPDRVVIDLVGAKNAVRVANRSFESGPVQRLRVSQFKTQPQMVTRVVADLRTNVGFTLESQNEDLVLVVGGSGNEAAGTSTGATPAVPDAVGDPAVTAPVSAPTSVDAVAPVGDTAPVASTAAAPGETTGVAVAPVAPSASSVTESQVATTTPAGGEATSATPQDDAAKATPVPDADGSIEPVAAPQVAAAQPVASARVASSRSSKSKRAQTASADAVGGDKTWEVGGSTYVEDTSPDAPKGVSMQPVSGRRINLDVQGADIHTVLRTLSDYSGKNIIAGQEVEGTVTARLFDTPWEDALASILKAHGYGYVEETGIIRVGVMQKIRNEELEEAAADRKREDLLPIVTQVVHMEFADATELKPALADMLSQRGKLQVDTRTNALIVSDIPDYVTKVSAMAHDLDSRTPQVEIVSKLVDVSADDSQDLGINWQAINIHPSGSRVVGSAGVDERVTSPAGGLRLGTVQSWGQLDAVLDALAKKKKANIVSNPNITTVNNREANILVGAKIPLIVADQAGNAITQLTKIGIMMRVTPHVNSDKTITMDMHTEVSDLSSQATVQGGVIIQTSEADTRVLVDSEETAIVGGLMRNVESETRTGIPVLQDIPMLGALFRTNNHSKDKRELIIFVTPRIIEPGAKHQGNGGGQG